MTNIIDGKELSKTYRNKIKGEIEYLVQAEQRIPHLAVILVGENEGSLSYVRSKEKACANVGMKSTVIKYPEDISNQEIREKIAELNENPDIDGILVQLPLPAHLNKQAIINSIDPQKDVDGLHPLNIGKMQLQEEALLPCTPQGILALLDSISIDISGKEVVVIGRSQLVGTPTAELLKQRDATVTLCHSKTVDIVKHCQSADILIVAIGSRKYIKAEWIKEGAVVIDVGINRDSDNKLVGDVDFENVKEKASYITPVPGGVGPMTVAMLLANTLTAYKRRNIK